MIGFPIVGKIGRWKTLISGTHPVGHRRLSQAELVPFGPSTLPSPSTSARTIIRIPSTTDYGVVPRDRA